MDNSEIYPKRNSLKNNLHLILGKKIYYNYKMIAPNQ